jgi:hypothetical protein
MKACKAMDDVADLRQRVGKLCGMVGSDQTGEKSNALAAIDQALSRAGKTWAWIGEIVARGELADSAREKLLARLIAERLNAGLDQAWSMDAGDAAIVREIVGRCETGLAQVDATELARVIGLADGARRRAGVR